MAIEVEISGDGMSAWATVVREEDVETTLPVLRAALRSAGVAFGIDVRALLALVEEVKARAAGERIRRQIASGAPRVDGTDARVEILVEDPRRSGGTERQDGRIDFRDQGQFVAVARDQLLARLHPGKPGTDGRDVRGRKIGATPAQTARLPEGSGTKVAGAGLELRAKRAGVLRTEPGRISVDELLRIAGDLDYRVGNIDCRGSVQIRGDVLPDFHIRADGDVWIDGSIDSVEVKAGGTVHVGQGILRGSRVHAAMDVSAGHLIESYVEAGRDVLVQREVLHSTVNAGGSVLVRPGSAGDPHAGRIVGGAVRARLRLEAAVAGKKSGVATELVVGVDPLVAIRCLQLRAEAERLRSNARRFERLRPLTATRMAPELDRLAQAQEEDLRRIELELARLEAARSPDPSAYVKIGREINEGVRIWFGPSELAFYDSRCGGWFVFDSTRGRITERRP
ncbi:MAG: DUF342 domain-containing protein [Deltaproteobacteria bacterium]|nr:DUF342 domain-containing protein [Deltaproteobacteria bacterium]